jgi:hypothetical protein
MRTIARPTDDAGGRQADADADERDAHAQADAAAGAHEAHDLGTEAWPPSHAATQPQPQPPERPVCWMHRIPAPVAPNQASNRHLFGDTTPT